MMVRKASQSLATPVGKHRCEAQFGADLNVKCTMLYHGDENRKAFEAFWLAKEIHP